MSDVTPEPRIAYRSPSGVDWELVTESSFFLDHCGLVTKTNTTEMIQCGSRGQILKTMILLSCLSKPFHGFHVEIQLLEATALQRPHEGALTDGSRGALQSPGPRPQSEEALWKCTMYLKLPTLGCSTHMEESHPLHALSEWLTHRTQEQ